MITSEPPTLPGSPGEPPRPPSSDESYYLPGENPIPVPEIIWVKLMENPPRDPFLQSAIDDAKQGLAEGGIPIGSVLVLDGRVVGRGHNRRVQTPSRMPGGSRPELWYEDIGESS